MCRGCPTSFATWYLCRKQGLIDVAFIGYYKVLYQGASRWPATGKVNADGTERHVDKYRSKTRRFQRFLNYATHENACSASRVVLKQDGFAFNLQFHS